MAKKIAQKPQQKKPISKRTDWAKMKREIMALHLRLQCQMPGEFSVSAPNSVMDVLIALLAGELGFCSAEQKIREITLPKPVFERTDWVNLQAEIRERVEHLVKRPELENRQREYKDLEMIFIDAMFGNIGICEAADKAREMLVPKSVFFRNDSDNLRAEIFERLARLREGANLKEIPSTPEAILLAHTQGECSFEEAVFFINRLIGGGKDGK